VLVEQGPDRGCDQGCAVAVLDVDGMHYHHRDMAERISCDMFLAPFDLLASIIASRVVIFCVFDRGDVDDPGDRRGFTFVLLT